MALNMKKIGDDKVQLWDGSHTHLNRLWKNGPLVLVFLRHYG